MEIKRAGGVWNPDDARVVGIVWGNSTKSRSDGPIEVCTTSTTKASSKLMSERDRMTALGRYAAYTTVAYQPGWHPD